MLSQIWVTGNYTNNDHIHLNRLQRLTAKSVQFLDAYMHAVWTYNFNTVVLEMWLDHNKES